MRATAAALSLPEHPGQPARACARPYLERVASLLARLQRPSGAGRDLASARAALAKPLPRRTHSSSAYEDVCGAVQLPEWSDKPRPVAPVANVQARASSALSNFSSRACAVVCVLVKPTSCASIAASRP